jgi:DNA repair ATPase RecN
VTNEEFQKLVLQELTGIKNKVNSIETIQISMESRLDNMESRLDNMESRLDEIYQVLRAIEHSNQVGKSEMDGQGTRLAKVEGKLRQAAKVFTEDVVV